MKIGILTLPFNNNYGGYLQAYALMTVLKQEGHEVELIYRQHNRCRYPLSYYIKTIVKMIFGRPHGPLNPTRENILRWKGKLMMPFVDKYIVPRTKVLQSSKELQSAVEQGNYDVIVCGSDQLWRPDYVPNIEDFFCTFVKGDKPKLVSYAASFGTNRPIYSEEQRKVCGEAISRFSAVSVREQSGMDVIKSFGWHTENDPVVVLDPTMLLPKEHYLSLLPNADSPSKGKVFCYVLDNSDEVKNKTSEIISHLDKDKYEIADIQKSGAKLPSIEVWLSAIRDADLVITDSFHGTVFSIIFNKPFVVFTNKKRGADRFETLLSHFGLKVRKNFVSTIETPISWTKVNAVLNEHKNLSLKYLINNING